MTPQDFTYWLQGFVEMTEADTISEAQWKMIKEHLKLTMIKVTNPLRVVQMSEHTPIDFTTDWFKKYSIGEEIIC